MVSFFAPKPAHACPVIPNNTAPQTPAAISRRWRPVRWRRIFDRSLPPSGVEIVGRFENVRSKLYSNPLYPGTLTPHYPGTPTPLTQVTQVLQPSLPKYSDSPYPLHRYSNPPYQDNLTPLPQVLLMMVQKRRLLEQQRCVDFLFPLLIFMRTK